jgi:hypothetical protein
MALRRRRGREPGADAVISLAERTPAVVRPVYVTDRELPWLYRNGSGFVLMSLLEGLGLPVIEAIDYGLPCLVSGSSILAKAGGTAKLQADPQDTASIATAMKSLADMSEDERAAFLGPHTYLPIRTGPHPHPTAGFGRRFDPPLRIERCKGSMILESPFGNSAAETPSLRPPETTKVNTGQPFRQGD